MTIIQEIKEMVLSGLFKSFHEMEKELKVYDLYYWNLSVQDQIEVVKWFKTHTTTWTVSINDIIKRFKYDEVKEELNDSNMLSYLAYNENKVKEIGLPNDILEKYEYTRKNMKLDHNEKGYWFDVKSGNDYAYAILDQNKRLKKPFYKPTRGNVGGSLAKCKIEIGDFLVLYTTPNSYYVLEEVKEIKKVFNSWYCKVERLPLGDYLDRNDEKHLRNLAYTYHARNITW